MEDRWEGPDILAQSASGAHLLKTPPQHPFPTILISIPNKHQFHLEAYYKQSSHSPSPDQPAHQRCPRSLGSGASRAQLAPGRGAAHRSRLDDAALLAPLRSRALMIWPQFTAPKSYGALLALNCIPPGPKRIWDLTGGGRY